MPQVPNIDRQQMHKSQLDALKNETDTIKNSFKS